MKKGGFWWFAVAALFAVSGLYSLVSGTEGGFVTLIVAAVLAFVGYRKRKLKAPKSSSAPSTASGACPSVIVCKVAGVTFKNENGSSRQAILTFPAGFRGFLLLKFPPASLRTMKAANYALLIFILTSNEKRRYLCPVFFPRPE